MAMAHCRSNGGWDTLPLGDMPGPGIDKKVDADFNNAFPDACDESDMKRQ